jgi:hypothetical protein
MVTIQAIALGWGWTVTFNTASSAVISEVRNAIVGHFLKSGADRLLMLDADQSLAPESIERMLGLDKPVVGCIYPKRRLQWSEVNLKTATNIDDILYQASDYVGRLEFSPQGTTEVVNGFGKALHVGTGILLIRREAFEAMMEAFPDLRNRGFHDDMFPGLDGLNWGFFNHIEVDGECSLSEDVSFCRRWRSLGGEIWADVTSNSTHTGAYHYRGNYLDHLKAKGAINPV